ncbi:hypothetical protein ARMGADRAFT_946208, partial [Armillaria gallica]
MKEHKANKAPLDKQNWYQKHVYVCSRQGSGGKKNYERKSNNRRNIPEKRIDGGCKARLTIKTYPDTTAVRGLYNSAHSHPIGSANLVYTNLSKETLALVQEKLRQGVNRKEVVRLSIRCSDFDESDRLNPSDGLTRDKLITYRDVARVDRDKENQFIRLDRSDDISVLKHVERLRDGGHFVFLKGRMPVAWMMSSDGTQPTIEFYLRTVRSETPAVIPKEFMTDRDHAQINAIEHIYPESTVRWCKWHVLHAWRQHFCIPQFPVLWDLLQKWIRASTHHDFDSIWQLILNLDAHECPPSVIAYLKEYWINFKHYWSAVYRQERT